MTTKVNNSLPAPAHYSALDQRVQVRGATPLDQMYSSSLTSSATDACTCHPPQHWFMRCAVRILEPVDQLLQRIPPNDRERAWMGVFAIFSFIIVVTMPIWSPPAIIIGITRACYWHSAKAVAYFKARNLNEEDKKLVDLKFSDSYYLELQSLHRTLKEELRVKVFQNAKAANKKWYTVIPNDPDRSYDLSEGRYTLTHNDPDWFNHTVTNCPQHHVARIRCQEYFYFLDAVDELIAEKINLSRA